MLPPHSRLVSQPWVSYTDFSHGSRHRLSAPAPLTFPQPRLPSPPLSPGSPRRPLSSGSSQSRFPSAPVPLTAPRFSSLTLNPRLPSTVPSPGSPHARGPAAEGARPPRQPARAAGAAGVREQLRLAPLRHRAPPGPGLPAEPPGPGWGLESFPGAAGRAQPRAGRQREESGERRRAERRQPQQQQRYGRARASPECLRDGGSIVPSLCVPGIAVQQNSWVMLPLLWALVR